MGVTTLLPTHVQVTDQNTYVPGYIVGDPTTMWRDGSDDTWAQVEYTSRSPAADQSDRAHSSLTPLDSTDVTEITVYMRYRLSASGDFHGLTPRVIVDFFDGLTYLIGLPYNLYPEDYGTIHDLTYTLTPDDYAHAATDFAGVVAGLTRAPEVWISRLDNLEGDDGFASYGISVYEFALNVTTGSYRRPSLRQLHRGGRGGIGGIPRAVGDRTVYGSPRRGPGLVR